MDVECKEELERLINEEYKRRNPKINRKPHYILSSAYDYCRNNEILYLTIKNVVAYMQKDDGAFDSWALVIKNLVKEVNKVILKWKKPEDTKNLHYQRFLYRVQKATSVYKEWLSVEDDCKSLLNDLIIKHELKYIVNEPLSEPKKDAIHEEAKIERLFVWSHNDRLASAVNMDNSRLYNQLPVGLFKDNIGKENRVFPSSNAMIDIWGIDHREHILHVFELKKTDEYYMGIYSELFFYAMFQMDIISGQFEYRDISSIKDINAIKYFIGSYREYIKAHFLATKLHPLIDKKLLVLVNDALKPYNIQFDFVRYSIDQDEPQKIVECKIEY